jgi:hypothetical protein
MTRFLIKVFLSLCFLLLKGYGHLYANTDQHSIYKSLQQLSESSVQVSPPNVGYGQLRISSAPSSGAKKEKIKATEVKDEEESSSGRKHLQISHYYLLYPQSPASYYSYHKHPLPFCNHFSYYSSDKFIVHRVIRI